LEGLLTALDRYLGFLPRRIISPKGANVNAMAWEGRFPLLNTYLKNCPEGRNNRVLRSDAIAIFVIFDPPGARGQKSHEMSLGGLISFNYISAMDV
jgi:hypothetical protein